MSGPPDAAETPHGGIDPTYIHEAVTLTHHPPAKMLSSPIGLLSISLLVGSVLSHQLPLTSSVTERTHDLLDESFDEFLAAISAEWGIKGLSVAVVRRQSNGNWHTETKGYGVKNAAGDPVTEDVSSFLTQKRTALEFTSHDFC